MSPSQSGHLAMLAFSALVAGSFSLGVLAAPHIAPAALNAVRFLIAAVIVGVAATATTGLPASAFRAPWRYLLMGGVFGTYFVLMFEGLKTADPVAASAVFTLVPVMAAGFGWVLLRQVTTTRMALALAIGAAGAVWVIFRADPAALIRFEVGRGEWIYFWGCVAHAIYTPLVPKLNRGEPAVVFTFGMLCGACIMVGGYGARDILATDWAALPAIVWITILYVAVFASAMTFVLMQFASLRLPSAKVMAYTYLVPSWVILWEIAKGSGLPPVATLAGVALTVLSLAMLLKD
ncbi:integral membrane protein [Pseudooceanicola batsensis HTCC2597]|uniref:Integral membrane protein n=1 Tax=Pseudooceanicola batsensis (strain ATCC BAA-863 / DSM 15984 / KCTC 12145 / HTCC2597) TaxID=252305 RepID=A3TVJ6_PSEBH|nr:DMT family transporter [Pseudooceanicola batsensis]EAQ03642.1 integral membrane protein [Pseudooceanicola batsensis HTCC2597]